MKFFVSLLIGMSMVFTSTALAATDTKEAAPAETKEVKSEVKEAAVPSTEQSKPAEDAKETAVVDAVVDPEKVVVTVNETAIREKQITVETDKRIATQSARMAAMGWPSDESSKKMMRDHYRDGVVDLLIERQLVSDQLKATKITVTPRRCRRPLS